ncbi:MAG: DUF2167 domain-containing protein, partial [Verrucomicrobiota bacterium]
MKFLLYVLTKKRGSIAPMVAILLCCACLLCHAGAGVQQASALDQLPDLSLQPLAAGGRAWEQQLSALDQIQWITGPAKAGLGKIAEVNIPEGYKFADERSARSLLKRMKNPVPKDLVGILAPASGEWFAVLEFGDIGYVRDDDKDRLDAGAMLNAVRRTITRQNKEGSTSGQVPINSADWELRPVYDPSEHKLEWAIRIRTGDQAEVVINHAVRLFGRRGVLNVIAVQPHKSDLNLAPLREIAKGISFKAGECYRDYQQGDKLARSSLADLVINENGLDSNSESDAAQDESKAWWVRIGWGLLVFTGLVLAGIGLISVVLKRLWLKRMHGSLGAEKQSVESAATPQSLLANQVSQAQSVATAMADAPANNQGIAAPAAMTERNGETSKNRDRKRKKHYNFHEFYTHMIMELSRGDTVGFVPNNNGHSDEVKSSARSPLANGVTVPEAAKVLVTKVSNLVESHQRLIEQQRKFIEEQNKLIEEKSKLIDIESRVL